VPQREKASACAICRRELPEKDFFIVRIEGFYTPELPEFTLEDLANATRSEIQRICARMRTAGAEELLELEEEVYRNYTYLMCRDCYRRYISRPLPAPEELY